jgi:hypothetical protein
MLKHNGGTREGREGAKLEETLPSLCRVSSNLPNVFSALGKETLYRVPNIKKLGKIKHLVKKSSPVVRVQGDEPIIYKVNILHLAVALTSFFLQKFMSDQQSSSLGLCEGQFGSK